jgi:hypothetical protein
VGSPLASSSEYLTSFLVFFGDFGFLPFLADFFPAFFFGDFDLPFFGDFPFAFLVFLGPA